MSRDLLLSKFAVMFLALSITFQPAQTNDAQRLLNLLGGALLSQPPADRPIARVPTRQHSRGSQTELYAVQVRRAIGLTAFGLDRATIAAVAIWPKSININYSHKYH